MFNEIHHGKLNNFRKNIKFTNFKVDKNQKEFPNFPNENFQA
jgi:hypothetical protein